jgi:hypothetical protein
MSVKTRVRTTPVTVRVIRRSRTNDTGTTSFGRYSVISMSHNVDPDF